MRTSTLVALAAAGTAQLVAAHTTVYAVLINDVDQGLGNSASGFIRSPPDNSPIKDVSSASMACNVNNAATAKTLEVKGGDKITFEWHHDSRDASDDIIAESHKGPVLTYIAPTESNGEGDVWVKLAEEGFADGKWAVDNLIANKGKHSITLPDLAAGEYLLRPEIIALHEGNKEGGAQLYMECVQIKVTSSGATTLPAGVAIPGTYTATDKGILFDIYGSFDSYPIPGPKVFKAGDAPANPAPAPASSAAASAPAASAPVESAPASSAAAPSGAAPTDAAPTDAVPSSAAATPAPSAPPAPTTLETVVVSQTGTAGSAAPSEGASTGTATKYSQCGGMGFTGATTCESGTTCTKQNDYYSQCL
ncbi:endo-beta-1,4-glucanase D [Polyplosphaeria fusca]|uniref:AA9 family lytic polysaccharide monooxygenase n=1 Tax=Polyplosphaeria fusca TaxID=682080 RepID=A0A9P4QR02_9PLEO|nr:endo-beta-1,4-glucanase D [Polyplosphaeria fusca]